MQIFVHKFNELNEIGLIVHRLHKGHRFTVSLKAPQNNSLHKLNIPAGGQGCLRDDTYLFQDIR